MMVGMKSLSEKKTVASESEFVTLLDTRGVIVDAIQVSDEDIVNETHLDPKDGNMVLKVTVLGASHFDEWETIFLVSNLRRHRERQEWEHLAIGCGGPGPFYKYLFELCPIFQ